MRRCVLCGRWLLLAFQVEAGEFVCEAARLGLEGSRRMRRRVLCGCWARLAFPEGSGGKKEKKQFSHSVVQSECCSQKYCSPRALLLLLPAVARKDLPPPSRAEHSPTVSAASIFAAFFSREIGKRSQHATAAQPGLQARCAGSSSWAAYAIQPLHDLAASPYGDRRWPLPITAD